MTKKIRRIPKRSASAGKTKIIKKNIKNKSNFNLPSKESMQIEKYKRELRRTRNSASFRMGNTIISNLIKPWKIILLPFKLITLSWSLVAERLGYKKAPYYNYSLDNNSLFICGISKWRRS